MNYKIGVLALVALQAFAVSAQRPCVCARNLRPVCGSDGVTYSNECRLRCEQSKGNSVTKAFDGPCKSSDAVQVAVPCTCPDNLNEVCGSDGKTYANDCLLNCATAFDSTLSISHPGRCLTVKVANFPILPPCTCPSTVSPVCGTNGQTYSNDCLLNCATANDPSLGISHAGACGHVNVVNNVPSNPQGGCTCTRDRAPVCGSNGVTYNNICLLECAGQSVARYGSC